MSTRKWLEPIDEPWILRSRRKSKPCNSIFWPNGIMPTMVAVPPGASGMSLCCQKQFANLGHADRTIAEQMPGDRALGGIFRQLERIVGRHPVIDHHARQQQPSGVAAHLVDASTLPRQRHGTSDMIEQTGGTPRIAL